MNNEKLQKVIGIIRTLREDGMSVSGLPANNASSGQIAGFPPEPPPVFNKTYLKAGKGSRRLWLLNLTNKSKKKKNA